MTDLTTTVVAVIAVSNLRNGVRIGCPVRLIEVYTCCSYPAVPGPRTPAQWAAVQFVRALKGQKVTGRSLIPLPGGKQGCLDQSTACEATDWFGRIAAVAIPWEEFGVQSLIPVPNAWCHAGHPQPPRTALLAHAIAAALPQKHLAVSDSLRWAAPMEAAHHQNGTRDPQELYGALRLRDRRTFDRHRRYVIVDDVLVTGGHLRAVAAFLADCGATVAARICAARAEHVLRDNPFQPRVEYIPVFVADPDWLLPFSDAI